ncbi:MAG: YkgJ family cysteine cluster protein [Pseudomonadota bacterium]
MTRADRRRAEASATRTRSSDTTAVLPRLRAAKAPGTPPKLADRARKALLAYAKSAADNGLPLDEIITRLTDGRAAMTVYQVETDEARQHGADPQTGAACKSGCAFCCILGGTDGGTITATEAARLYTALLPLSGQPDGRSWHPKACAALDPETRTCRAYDARPSICRSFHSTDVSACEANADGAAVEGPRLEGAHATYLAAHGLARAALAKVGDVPTFSMSAITAAAIDGLDADATWRVAQHGSDALDAERKRTGKAWQTARRMR